MKKIILVAVLVSVLPALASAEEKRMQNTNPSPTERPEHVMRNTNPSPDPVPEHVMKNTNPNSSASSTEEGGKKSTEEAVDIQHLRKN